MSLQPGLGIVIVDISGGGLRFLSSQKYEPGSLILCSYHLLKDGERKKYDVVGKVLAVKELENRRGMFEHRVQYYNLDVNTREEIIRFIFEEERKSRKKERLELMQKILVVDDSAPARRVLCDIIDADIRFQVVDRAKDGLEAFDLLSRNSYDAVVLDVNMPRMNGLQLLQELRNTRYRQE